MVFLRKSSLNKFSFLKYLILYKKQILILFLLNLLSSSLLLIGPYLSKLFIDKAFIARSFYKFWNLSIWGAALFVFAMLVKVSADVIKNRIAIKLKLNLTSRFIRKFYSLDISFFQSKSVGENIYRFSDAGAIPNFILEQCPNLLADIFKLPIILGISLWINLPMTVSLLLLSPLFLIHGAYLQKKLRPIYEEMWKYSARLSQKVYEAFSKILIIKALGLESYQRRTYLESLIENIRWQIRSFRWAIISSLSSSFLSKAVYGLITLYGGWLIIKGRLSLGSYTAIMLYLNQLGGLLQSFGNRLEYFSQEMISIQKFSEIMESIPQIKDSPQARIPPSIRGEIQFKDIWFGYQKEKPIFKGLDFAIPAFSWVGIVGPSGCGKTTLVNLILRLYEPWRGEMLLDGLGLRVIKLRLLREKIAIATQQPFLFDVSIRENITYGLKDIGQTGVEEAARIACIDDFIAQLPKGYDTLVGDDACQMSQGLRQRLAVARAIIRNPHILILDEATSSVDSVTEEKIFRALREKRQGLSTIIISHRLFSVRDADRIYFLKEDGKLEEGLHYQLLSESPAYKDFFRNQIEEKKEEEEK